MDVNIRAVNHEDTNAVADLSAQLEYSINAEQVQQHIAIINSSINDIAYVATIDDVVAGWIHILYTVRMECPPYCEVAALVIDECQRGKGIGNALIAYIKPWCKEKRTNKIIVRSNVLRANAHRFYERAGFTIVKDQRVFELSIG